MAYIFVLASLGIMLHLIFSVCEFYFGYSSIKDLSKVQALNPEQLPFISIIFSALNEEDHIEAALTSLLLLDYPAFEVIAVNDRSTDRTPAILENLKSKYKHLQVIHVNHLPENWLGKNHALSLATQHARGEWFLFTDADVMMKKQALTKSMSYAIKNKLDHLTIYEQHLRQRFWLKVILLGSYITYSMAMKPWRIKYQWSNKFLGHGAFNLIKAKVYQQCGGHQAIALECLDDLMLGKLLKMNQYRQDVVNGYDYIEREWYDSVSSMIKGLQKNSFAYFNFSFGAALLDISLCLTYFFWPLVAVMCMNPTLRMLNLINILLTLVLTMQIAKHFRLATRFAIFYPISLAMMIFTVVSSIYSTYKNKGIIWRNTHYPIDKLRHCSKS